MQTKGVPAARSIAPMEESRPHVSSLHHGPAPTDKTHLRQLILTRIRASGPCYDGDRWTHPRGSTRDDSLPPHATDVAGRARSLGAFFQRLCRPIWPPTGMQRLALKTGNPPAAQALASPLVERVPVAEEIALFQAIQQDASDWQRRAFDDYYRLVYGLLVKALGPHGDVEDLVSDVFVGFFESAKNIRQASGIRSYIVSIAMNVVRREVRQRKRRRLIYRLVGGPGDWERGASTDDPKAKAALLQLSRILDDIDTEERIAFVLSGLEGLTMVEIAEVLHVSLSTAKRRVRRANEHVRKRVSRNALLADYIRDRSGGSHG